MDCCPGRLNQTAVFIKRPGLFMGQCSEICGINHAFMPINVIGLNFNYSGHALNNLKVEGVLAIFY